MTGNHSNSDHSHHQPGAAHEEDLLSAALRYVLDEMAVEERDEFECRLLGRQDVREAVAEAVALCQSAKYAVDAVMRDATSVSGLRPVNGVDCVQRASQTEHVWRSPAACAAMVVAASIVMVIVMTGIRGGNPFNADLRNATIGVESAALQRQTNGEADRARQLAVAWLRFLPSADEATRPADSVGGSAVAPAYESLAADNESAAEEDANDDVSDDDVSDESGPLGGDEDFIARIDSATAANDWVFQAVAAEPSSSAIANPREG